MDQFVSTFTNKIDAKGRVSVPASFRAVLAKDGAQDLYVYPSLDDEALDAGGQRLVARIHALVDELAPYSDESDQLRLALFGASENLAIDPDGRIVLSERLRKAAGLTNQVTFVGLGDKFQMWEPEKFDTHFKEGRRKLSELKKLLGAGSRKRGDAEGARE